MTMYFLLMLVVAGGNSAPLMVFTTDSGCQLARTAYQKETFCQRIYGEKP